MSRIAYATIVFGAMRSPRAARRGSALNLPATALGNLDIMRRGPGLRPLVGRSTVPIRSCRMLTTRSTESAETRAFLTLAVAPTASASSCEPREIDAITEQMRGLVEREWPGLAHSLDHDELANRGAL
jgi:hypothetical protein